MGAAQNSIEQIHALATMKAEEERRRYGPQEPTTTVFRFISADEICTMPRTTSWIVKGFLDQGALSLIFGEPESMKSFVAIDIGMSIAAGREYWQGQRICKSGHVFYIAGEGRSGIGRRLSAWAQYHAVDLATIPFYVSDRPARFLDTDGAKEVVLAMDDLISDHNKPPILVIVDTLNRNFGAGDENATKDMSRFVATIDEAIRTRYHCTVLIIHHSGLAARERARGASALRAALDWEYSLVKSSDGTRTLSCTKSKDYEPPPSLYFKPEIVSLGWNEEDQEELTSCVLIPADEPAADTRRLTGARKIAYEALLSVGDEYVHIDTWRAAAYAQGISESTENEARKKAFSRARKELLDAGIIKVRDDHYWATARNEIRLYA